MIDWRNWTVRQTRAALLAGLVGVPMLAVSAKAAVVAYYEAQRAEAPPLPPIGYESEDHFPGAALFYVADDQAAPSAGTTGTTALPDLPVPTDADLTPDTDGTVRPAQPFSMNGAGALDKARALDCLATAIYYEAASESEEGQRAVAQVILNRVRHPAFPSTVCGVVYQGSEKSTGCQFSYACDGSMARVPMRSAMDRARRYALDALNGYVMKAVGLATHYHTYQVTPAWNRSLVMTDAIGMHFFHRWKGYWGTPAAFSNLRYHGGEPVPGPHARIAPPPGMPLPSTQFAAYTPGAAAPGIPGLTSPPPPSTNLAAIQPDYRDTSIAKAPSAPAADDNLPAASQVLDRWKDSGEPLR
ncbi:MAG: cell wall hydrolase [Sphingomonas sp.]|uniref:cell wall hydrolase n=1 Tax=Sphingomonas sp. TaxID=28214 RepID=UPI003F7E5FFE